MTRPALALIILAAVNAIDVRGSAAQYSPWCYEELNSQGISTCAFSSYQQCRMTATPGTGGVCVQNPWYWRSGGRGPGPSEQSRRPRR